jgi:hypothetical protein
MNNNNINININIINYRGMHRYAAILGYNETKMRRRDIGHIVAMYEFAIECKTDAFEILHHNLALQFKYDDTAVIPVYLVPNQQCVKMVRSMLNQLVKKGSIVSYAEHVNRINGSDVLNPPKASERKMEQTRKVRVGTRRWATITGYGHDAQINGSDVLNPPKASERKMEQTRKVRVGTRRWATITGYGHDAQIGDAQIGDAQIGDAQIGDAQIGDAQIGDAQIGDAQIGDAQINGSDVPNPPKASERKMEQTRKVRVGTRRWATITGYGRDAHDAHDAWINKPEIEDPQPAPTDPFEYEFYINYKPIGDKSVKPQDTPKPTIREYNFY